MKMRLTLRRVGALENILKNTGIDIELKNIKDSLDCAGHSISEVCKKLRKVIEI